MINERLEKRSSETVVLDKDLLDMFMEELYRGKFRGERDIAEESSRVLSDNARYSSSQVSGLVPTSWFGQ